MFMSNQHQSLQALDSSFQSLGQRSFNDSRQVKKNKIFDDHVHARSQTLDRRSPTVSLIPISNQQINAQNTLQRSHVTEFEIPDQPIAQNFLMGLGPKVKFIKVSKKDASTQADETHNDQLIKKQQEMIEQLQQRILELENDTKLPNANLEFSFHNTLNKLSDIEQFYEQRIRESSNKQEFMENVIFPQPVFRQSTQQQVQEYSKQKTNKEYFFSQYN